MNFALKSDYISTKLCSCLYFLQDLGVEKWPGEKEDVDGLPAQNPTQM